MTELPEPTELVLCRRCGEMVGPWRDPDGKLCFASDCACGRISPETRSAEPEFDTLRGWERRASACDRGLLCKCCATVWLRDRSRWAIWFCRDGCLDKVRDLNASASRVVVPVGRHSIVNQSSVNPRAENVDAQIKRFVRTMDVISEVGQRLDRWVGVKALRNLELAGVSLDHDLPVERYLEIVSDVEVDRDLAFAGMCEFLRADPEG